MKKPSERIRELCKNVCAKAGKHQPSTKDLAYAMPFAIASFLDEEDEKRQAQQAGGGASTTP